ncbi:hypothetical protein A4E84_25870 [Streptomyces qaidamensis]|uniref:Uncharacterized protein n=1 Tax=Streptomyces qaidamensis TaxID=1783515 RepID=A0A143C5Z7_9ACTN|nr:hypothetical protein A4E84_25870 [Streptomyces qaidamensis]
MPHDEEMWDPQIPRWHDPEGDHVLPRALRTLPEPWNEGDWNRIAELPRTDERLMEAQRVITALLEDRDLSPPVPEPPSPGLLWHVWEEFHRAVGKSMPRMVDVTWTGVDELVRTWRERPQLYPLQRHVVRHVEAAMLAMIPSLRNDVADSVFRWLALDPDPGRFADWAVALAECCVTEDIGADAAIELLGAMGGPEAWAALERLSMQPDGPAAWKNAEAAQGALWNPENRGRRGPNPPPPARQPPTAPRPAPPTRP